MQWYLNACPCIAIDKLSVSRILYLVASTIWTFDTPTQMWHTINQKLQNFYHHHKKQNSPCSWTTLLIGNKNNTLSSFFCLFNEVLFYKDLFLITKQIYYLSSLVLKSWWWLFRVNSEILAQVKVIQDW